MNTHTEYLVRFTILAGGQATLRVSARDNAHALEVAEARLVAMATEPSGGRERWAFLRAQGVARPVSARKAPRRAA
jgi:hypothetical protein